MNLSKIAVILPMLLLAAGSVWAAALYGEATIERGAMTVVREGRSLKFDQLNQEIEINEEDLIRVRPQSRVTLRTREMATIALGSNAVFHVKPWRSKGKSGFLRALFGRFRASVVALAGGEQFNVKTATATIGVKGTEYRTHVTNRGGTLLIVGAATVGFQGQQGPEVTVGENFLSLIININPPTPPAPIPPQVEAEFGSDDLDAPAPNSRAGRDFPGEEGLIEAGIVTEDELNEGKGDFAPPVIGELFPFVPPLLNFDANEASDAQRRATVTPSF